MNVLTQDQHFPEWIAQNLCTYGRSVSMDICPSSMLISPNDHGLLLSLVKTEYHEL